MNTILRLLKDRNSLLNCRLVNQWWNHYSSTILQSDYEIAIHFKKRLQFSQHTDVKIVPRPLDQLPLLTSMTPSSNFPCRNFLFQGVRIGENDSFNHFLCKYGDRVLKLEFEECEFPHSCAHMAEEKGKSCYQSFVYWVMQKVPNLTHFYCTENTFFATNKKCATTEQIVKDIEETSFQHLSEFHFRPDYYNELKHFPTPSITNDIINNHFVDQILAHSPNLKKFFSRPSIKKLDQLNDLLDGDNVSKLRNFSLNPDSKFNCDNTVRLIEKFVHENLSSKLALEELDIDITHLPFKSTVSQEQRDRSWTYMTLTNQLLENNKYTLKFLFLSTYDDEGWTDVEPMVEKLQFPELMPNVVTLELVNSADTIDAYLSSWKDFYNAIFFKCGSIWTQIFPHLQKFICWNFNVRDEDIPQFSKDDQDHSAAPFDYRMPSVTCLKVGESSNETIKYFGKVCPSVHHFIFWVQGRVLEKRIYWNSGKPLIFEDVIRRAIAYFPVLTKLEIELHIDVVHNVKLALAFAKEVQDDILAYLLLNSTVDGQQGSGELDHTFLDLKGIFC